VIADSNDAAGGILLWEEDSVSITSMVTLNIEEVQSSYSKTDLNTQGMIDKEGQGKIIANINKLVSNTRPAIVTRNSAPESSLLFQGNIYCNSSICLRLASDGRFVMKNSSLYRGPAGIDNNHVIVLGNAGGFAALPGGLTDDHKVEIIDTRILKQGTNDTGGAMVLKQGNISKLMLKDCDLVLQGPIGEACDVDIALPGDADIYFKNTVSNVVNNVNVVDSSVGGGFTGNDTALTIFDYVE
jgi:hypothetical protein